MLALLCAAYWRTGAVQATPASCVEAFLAHRRAAPALSIAPSDAERLVSEVAQSIGLTRSIKVVACTGVDKAEAWVEKPTKVTPGGEYIVYNPDWAREVIGQDQVQAIALFGHELGHFLNGDFTNGVEQVVQERNADRFAGCAVGRMSGDLARLEDLLSRLRLEKDAFYPDRLTSLQSAREGFAICSGQSLPSASSAGVAGPVQCSPFQDRNNVVSMACTAAGSGAWQIWAEKKREAVSGAYTVTAYTGGQMCGQARLVVPARAEKIACAAPAKGDAHLELIVRGLDPAGFDAASIPVTVRVTR